MKKGSFSFENDEEKTTILILKKFKKKHYVWGLQWLSWVSDEMVFWVSDTTRMMMTFIKSKNIYEQKKCKILNFFVWLMVLLQFGHFYFKMSSWQFCNGFYNINYIPLLPSLLKITFAVYPHLYRKTKCSLLKSTHLRQIGPGVPELWSAKLTDRNTEITTLSESQS